MNFSTGNINKPYSKLAEIYDRVMDHVDYKTWSAYVLKLARQKNTAIQWVIDLSCGTGQHLQYFDTKLELFGADKSFEMVYQAQKKEYHRAPGLFVQAAPHLAVKKNTFDLVTMLYDSINYIHEKNKIAILMDEVSRVLKAGGVFIFDVVTEDALLMHMDDYFETNTWDGQAYQRKAWYVPQEKVQYNIFSLYFNGEMHQEVHKQKIRTLKEWQQLIGVHFNLDAAYADFSLEPACDSSTRVHFLCSKKYDD